MHISIQECVEIQTLTLLATLWFSYGHTARNKHAGFLFEFSFIIMHFHCDLNIQDRYGS